MIGTVLVVLLALVVYRISSAREDERRALELASQVVDPVVGRALYYLRQASPVGSAELQEDLDKLRNDLEEERSRGRRRHDTWLRPIMQVLISAFALFIAVTIIFDGCYGWLGWCQDHASSADKNWAFGLVGTVIGFWLSEAG